MTSLRRLLSFLAATGALAQPALAAAPGWTLSDVTAGVTVRHAGTLVPARRGMALAGGDVVMTGGNARAMLVRGEEYAIVAPKTQLVVAADAAKGGMTQFVEDFGSVVFSVKKMLSPHFAVGTPYLAAVVKGTTFAVSVDDHSASVQVLEGAVQVSNAAGASALVRPGTIGKALAGGTDLMLSGAEHGSVSPPLTVSGMGARASGAFNRAALGTLRLVLPASAGSPELVYAGAQDQVGGAAPALIFAALLGIVVAIVVAVARAVRRRRARRLGKPVAAGPSTRARRYGEGRSAR